jgi:hypothetical protein
VRYYYELICDKFSFHDLRFNFWPLKTRIKGVFLYILSLSPKLHFLIELNVRQHFEHIYIYKFKIYNLVIPFSLLWSVYIFFYRFIQFSLLSCCLKFLFTYRLNRHDFSPIFALLITNSIINIFLFFSFFSFS